MTDTRTPTGLEIVDSLLPLATGAVLAAPMLPGFLLTVPALLLATVVVVAPLVAFTVVITLAGAILASPYLLLRALRGARSPFAPARRATITA